MTFNIVWVGWRGELFGWGFRLNTGGYLYGMQPYKYFRFGPILFKKYIK